MCGAVVEEFCCQAINKLANGSEAFLLSSSSVPELSRGMYRRMHLPYAVKDTVLGTPIEHCTLLSSDRSSHCLALLHTVAC